MIGVPAKSYEEYVVRWQNAPYRYDDRVRREAARLRCDGCSGVPDFYRVICDEHDIHFATHRDFYMRVRLEEEDANLYLQWGIQYFSWFGRWSPMAWWRYKVLSSTGLNCGREAWASGPARLAQRLKAQGPG